MKRICIIDDFFPNRLSLFRYIEYCAMLEKHNATLLTFSPEYSSHIGRLPKNMQEKVIKVEDEYFENTLLKVKADTFYTISFILTIKLLPFYRKHNLPFVLTLYPGFGFRFGDGATDQHIFDIVSSPSCKGIVATQKATYDYLVNKFHLPKKMVSYCHGGFADVETELEEKVKFKEGKDTLDICFMACKYHPQGKDKGYDSFVEIAESLSGHKDIRFHVAGDFDENTIKTNKANIKFYGRINKEDLPHWFKDKDIFVSPNKANALGEGSFDGFPTGSAIEAGINKCVLIVSDPLNNNPGFKSLYVEDDPKNILDLILGLKQNPELLYKTGEKTRKEILEMYSIETQLKAREHFF